MGFWGWGFQLMGFGACVVGAFWVSWSLGSLYMYKQKRITLGKTLREVILTCISLWSYYPKDLKLQRITILNSVSFANHLSIFARCYVELCVAVVEPRTWDMNIRSLIPREDHIHNIFHHFSVVVS